MRTIRILGWEVSFPLFAERVTRKSLRIPIHAWNVRLTTTLEADKLAYHIEYNVGSKEVKKVIKGVYKSVSLVSIDDMYTDETQKALNDYRSITIDIYK